MYIITLSPKIQWSSNYEKKKKKTRTRENKKCIGRVPVEHFISGYKYYRIIIYRSANAGDLFIELHSG